MSPIRDVSEVIRIPRIGKIRLGIKVQGEKSPYPKAVDYFVCPPEVEKVFGKNPTELQIMFPVDDPDMFAQQWLRRYSLTQGLTCIGDGDTCRRKVDTETGDFASHITKDWEWKTDLNCQYEECPEYNNKRCRRVMNLQFLMPDVPGLGVYQIDTSSWNSIVNINSMIKMLKGIFGRCHMLPLTLALGPLEVSPKGEKKKKVWCLHIRQDNIRLSELAEMAMLPVGRALLEEPEEGEERPDDLFPDEIVAEYSEQKPELSKHPKRKRSVKKTETAPPPPPDYVDSEIQEYWVRIHEFLKGEKAPNNETIQKWFNDHYQLEVTEEDLQQKYYPEQFTKQMLSHLHNSIEAYFEIRR